MITINLSTVYSLGYWSPSRTFIIALHNAAYRKLRVGQDGAMYYLKIFVFKQKCVYKYMSILLWFP